MKYSKNNEIDLFCLPAHCSHRVQPLDVSFFAPLQTYYNQEIQNWLKQYPGRAVTHFQVIGLFRKTYLKASIPINAINGFQETGIYPFNPDVFEECQFAPSKTTDREFSNASTKTKLLEASTEPENAVEDIQSITVQSIQELSPTPVAAPQEVKRKRKRSQLGVINTKQIFVL